MRGAADTTLQKDMKETQPLVFQPLTSPFDFLTVENESIAQAGNKYNPLAMYNMQCAGKKLHIFAEIKQKRV